MKLTDKQIKEIAAIIEDRAEGLLGDEEADPQACYELAEEIAAHLNGEDKSDDLKDEWPGSYATKDL